MELLKTVAEDIVLFGGAIMGLYYGIKRVYTTARNVEKLVEKTDQTEALNNLHRQQIKQDLEASNASRDAKLDSLTTSLKSVTEQLTAHIQMEETRDINRDQQLVQLTDHVNEIVAEMRPNGGSSMKDILNQASKKVDEVHTRVAVLEQWKVDQTPVSKRKIARKRK